MREQSQSGLKLCSDCRMRGEPERFKGDRCSNCAHVREVAEFRALCSSERLARCSPLARLLYFKLRISSDWGFIPSSTRLLRQLLPFDECDISKLIHELFVAGFVDIKCRKVMVKEQNLRQSNAGFWLEDDFVTLLPEEWIELTEVDTSHLWPR